MHIRLTLGCEFLAWSSFFGEVSVPFHVIFYGIFLFCWGGGVLTTYVRREAILAGKEGGGHSVMVVS